MFFHGFEMRMCVCVCDEVTKSVPVDMETGILPPIPMEKEPGNERNNLNNISEQEKNEKTNFLKLKYSFEFVFLSLSTLFLAKKIEMGKLTNV